MSAWEPGSAAPPPSGGLVDSLRRMFATLLAIVHTRVELLTTELEEEIQRAVGILLWALAAMFFAGLTVIMLAMTILIVAWDEHRVLAASLITVAFLVLTAAAGLVARQRFQSRQPLLSATLEEFRKDRDALEARRQ